MEEENEILGPDQLWSPDMLFTPSVEEEEEIKEVYIDSSEVDKILKKYTEPSTQILEELKIAPSGFYNESKNISQRIYDVEQAITKTKGLMDPDNAILQNELDRLNTLLKPTIEKEKEEEKEYYTTDEGLKELIVKKTSQTAKNIVSDLLRIPTAIDEATAALMLSDEQLERINELHPEARAAVISAGGNNRALSMFLYGLSNQVKDQIEKEDKNIYKFEEGIFETYKNAYEELRKGNFSDAGKKALQATAQGYSEAIPSLLYMAQASVPVVGLSSLLLGTAAGESGRKQDEAYEAKNELDKLSVDDPDYETKKAKLEKIIEKGDISGKLVAHSTLVGSAEALFDRYSAGLGRNLFKNLFGAPKDVLDRSLKEWGLQIAKDFTGEGLTETATSMLQDLSELLILGDEDAFVGKTQEYIDTFIIGALSGKTISATGAVPNIISRGVSNKVINNSLNKGNYDNIEQAFDIEPGLPDVPTELKTPTINETQIELSQIPVAGVRLNNSVDSKVSDGEITIEKGNQIKENFRDTQSAVNQLKPVGLNLNTEAVGLVIEKKKLENIIKEVNDKAITQTQQNRVNEINDRLGTLATEAQTQAEVEAAETVAMGVIPTRRAPRADELALQYQQDPANVDVEALLDQYNKIGLAAIKFDTRKGDMAREDAIAEINKEFAGIMERWSPEQGSFSTFVTANIAPKAQGIYDKYIGKRDVTTLDRPEAREVVAEEVDVDVTPAEVARPKVYPASLEVITENVTPEVRSEQTTMIKDDINRAVATVSTSPKAVAKNIVNQIKTKEYRQLLKDKLGRWNTEQYNNNVDRLITKDFIATLPVAQLKRRFPRLFEIEVIDRVPTVKIEDGKRTDFKKPVYRIPAITNAKLETIKDYFKANEKRHQSLMEVLGEGIAIEQMQELRGDQAFMTDLQGRLELKGSNLTAEQFLNEVEYNLDKRNLEDKSLDVVEGTVDSVVNEMITEDNVNDIETDVLSEAISKLETFRKTNLSMNALTGIVEAGLRTLRAGIKAGTPFVSAIKDFVKKIKDFIKKPAVKKPTPKKPEVKKPEVKEKFKPQDVDILKKIGSAESIKDIIKILGLDKVTINENNRESRQDSMLEAIINGKIPSIIFKAGSFANFGSKYKPGKIVNGKFIEDTKSKTQYYILKKPINGKMYLKRPSKKSEQLKLLKKYAGSFKANRGGLYYGTTDPKYITALEAAKKNDDLYPNLINPVQVKVENGFTKKGQQQSKDNLNTLESMVEILSKAVENKQISVENAALFITSSYQATKGIVKTAAIFKYKSKVFEHGKIGKNKTGRKFIEEHNPPASTIGGYLIYAIANNKAKDIMPLVRKNYYQTQLSKKDNEKLDQADLDKILPEGSSILNNSAIRLIKAGININTLVDPITGNTMAEDLGVPLSTRNQTPDNINAQNNILEKVILEGKTAKTALNELNSSLKINNLSSKQVNNNKEKVFGLIKENGTTEQSIVDMGNADQAAQIARDINAPTKGISVFDFDDTLAYSNSKVIVNMPDGTIKKITPAEFAVESENLLEQGADFDFSEFNKVVEGRKGPLADLALKRQEKFGSGDIFVLTARPQASATSIKAFLDGIGLNIPLKNITGLADGSPDAKALWVLDKAAKGYNDFYFADDALPNVQAVKNILDQVDVKSDIQQAKANKVKDLDKEFNVIIEQQSGKQWYKTYSKARAKTTGKKVGRFEFFIPPSAEDFSGLLYKILPKGERGDLAKKWFKDNLFDPFNKAEQELISAKITVAQDFQALRQNIDNIPKNLNKPVGVGDFTHSQALRVYIWNMQGMEIPGLSTRDLNRLVEKIEGNADLKVFAEKIAFIQKGKEYPAPGENWIAGNITSDIIQSLNKSGRKQFLQEWQQNVDIIFSDKNLNKLEALYGSNYIIALKNVLGRMKSGSNRPVGANPQVNALLDWLNNSVGAVMFLNMRSAGLQLISSVNFINWSDNNPVAAAKAFANQKQYWSDVMTLLNSDYLVQRRNGLKINVAESEIAEAARKGGMRGAIAYLLNKGFVLTRFADSMAIATGGATFYRNRVDKLLEQVNIDTGKAYTREEAEAQAFEDFYQISEESQQSSRTDRISMQQASSIGRLILNFANTPMQYARIMKKSAMDLKAGRGDWKTNLSKIAYYGFVQNLIFNAMQQAIFALAYGSDDEEERTLEDRAGNIADGMISSLLRGLGYGGAAVDTVKDVIASLVQQGAKKRPKYEDAVSEVFNFSPAIDSKVRKLRSALRSFSWNMKEMKRRGFSLDNPAYLAVSQIVSSTTNIPLDRAARIMMNIRQALDRQTEVWQKVALLFGYSGWELGLPYWGLQTTIDKEAEEDEAIKEKYKNDARKLKTQGFKRVPMTKGKPRGKLYEDYIQVPRPSGEIEYWLTPDSNSLRERSTNTGR